MRHMQWPQWLILPAAVLLAGVAFNCGMSDGTGTLEENDAGVGAGAGDAGPGLGFGGRGGTTGGRGGTSGGAGATGAGGTGRGGTTGAGGTTGTAGATGAGGSAAQIFGCQVANAQCSDGKDNDGDGKIDAADPECVGPCDNDEGSFATGIPGDNIDACKQDCFFDGNSGMGDDGCEWNLKCDPANPGGSLPKACPYDASFRNCPTAQSQKCVDFCRKLTPNGCDCFGCCAVTVNGQPASVLLVAGCTAATFGDAKACPRCTQNTACLNTCEKCEICVGKPTIDPSCPRTPTGGTGGTPGTGGTGGTPGTGGTGGTPGAGGTGGSPPPPPPPTPACDGGRVTCGPGGQVPENGCPSGGYYCVTGCCVKVIQ